MSPDADALLQASVRGLAIYTEAWFRPLADGEAAIADYFSSQKRVFSLHEDGITVPGDFVDDGQFFSSMAAARDVARSRFHARLLERDPTEACSDAIEWRTEP